MEKIEEFIGDKQEAKEIINFNDGFMMPKYDNKVYDIVRKAILVFIVLIIVGSLLFKESWIADGATEICLCLFIIWIYLNKHERVECPAQLRFYDDFLVFYVPKRHYRMGYELMEMQKIYYHDVTKCIFRTNVSKMVIFGMMDEVDYKYNSQGMVSDVPSSQKRDDLMIKFYTVFDHEHDFAGIIEKNSPLKVEYQNS